MLTMTYDSREDFMTRESLNLIQTMESLLIIDTHWYHSASVVMPIDMSQCPGCDS